MKFVAELKEEGIFAKEVRSAGVAFHSYYMASIAPTLLAALKGVCNSVVFKPYTKVRLKYLLFFFKNLCLTKNVELSFIFHNFSSCLSGCCIFLRHLCVS